MYIQGVAKTTPTKLHHENPDMKIIRKKKTIKGAQVLRFGVIGCRKCGKINSRA